jgi:hypothetical protein
MTAAYAPALNHGFEGFLDFLRDQEAGPAVLSPKRFSDVLSIDLQTLAGQAHVHRNTLSRAPASESVQRFMREALRVLLEQDNGMEVVAAVGDGETALRMAHELAPDVVVVGGGLVEALPKWFVEVIDQSARDHALLSLAKSLRVVPVRLGDDANVLGAAAWAEDRIADRPPALWGRPA